MNYSDIRKFDTTNGPGVSVSLFVSGCNFHCKGCFNEKAWNFKNGKHFDKFTLRELVEYGKNDHVDHISLLGGEVFHQDLDLILTIVKTLRLLVNKPIWVWTGFTFEELLEKRKEDFNISRILNEIDYLVDGRFDITKKKPNLLFRGSTNQRIINIKKTLDNLDEDKLKIVLYDKNDYL